MSLLVKFATRYRDQTDSGDVTKAGNLASNRIHDLIHQKIIPNVDRVDWSDPGVDVLEGVPGCGKTTMMQKNGFNWRSHVAIVPKNPLRDKLLDDMAAILGPPPQVPPILTFDNAIEDKPRYVCSRPDVWYDEAFSAPIQYILCYRIIMNPDAKLHLMGDREQIPPDPKVFKSCAEDTLHSRLDWFKVHPKLLATWRFSPEHSALVSTVTGRPIRTNAGYRGPKTYFIQCERLGSESTARIIAEPGLHVAYTDKLAQKVAGSIGKAVGTVTSGQGVDHARVYAYYSGKDTLPPLEQAVNQNYVMLTRARQYLFVIPVEGDKHYLAYEKRKAARMFQTVLSAAGFETMTSVTKTKTITELPILNTIPVEEFQPKLLESLTNRMLVHDERAIPPLDVGDLDHAAMLVQDGVITLDADGRLTTMPPNPARARLRTLCRRTYGKRYVARNRRQHLETELVRALTINRAKATPKEVEEQARRFFLLYFEPDTIDRVFSPENVWPELAEHGAEMIMDRVDSPLGTAWRQIIGPKTDFDLSRTPMLTGFLKVILKTKSKMELEMKPKAGQPIRPWLPAFSAIFAPMFRVLTENMPKVLRSKFTFASGMSEEEFIAKVGSGRQKGQKSRDSDVPSFDAGQTQQTHGMEYILLRIFFGPLFTHEVYCRLLIWLYEQLTGKAGVLIPGLLLILLKFQRLSGEPGTLIMNTVTCMFLFMLCYSDRTLNELLAAAFKGDDSHARWPPGFVCELTPQLYARFFPEAPKFNISDDIFVMPAEFCGYLIGAAVGTEPVRLAGKILSRSWTTANTHDRDEVAFKDQAKGEVLRRYQSKVRTLPQNELTVLTNIVAYQLSLGAIVKRWESQEHWVDTVASYHEVDMDTAAAMIRQIKAFTKTDALVFLQALEERTVEY